MTENNLKKLFEEIDSSIDKQIHLLSEQVKIINTQIKTLDKILTTITTDKN